MAMGMTPAAVLLVALCLAQRTPQAFARDELIKGISYGPVPLLSVEGASQLPQDDWMSNEALPMWGRSGRGDLKVIKDLGANLVRLYGNNPNNDHTNFLDEAHAEGLKVAPGMSDYPYFQQVPGNCQESNFNCFEQVKPLYAMNLAKGFLTPQKTYHPALEVMNIMNEADLKMPATTDIGGPDGPIKMGRTLISAFDAMLDAEREAGVTGTPINFTATFSYAICGPCEKFNRSPALGQMWQLDDAMHNPSKYGYTPKNDITKAYLERWTHSFNTQNPATDLKHQFLDDYEMTFPDTPVYIGEYHRVHANQETDLSLILGLAEHSPLFLGISFFEFQVAYWKTGSEMDFGMFGLGKYIISDMPYFGQTYSIHCLVPEEAPKEAGVAPGTTLPGAVATVFRGKGVDSATLCVPGPWKVSLNQDGYTEISSQQSLPQTEGFVTRVVQHLGATVKDASGLTGYAEAAMAGSKTWATLVSELAYGPDWVEVDPTARCVANRNAMPNVVGDGIGWVCTQAPELCKGLPKHCSENVYRTADFIFSRYYLKLGRKASPLTFCDFGGAGIYASRVLYNRWTGASSCMKGGHQDITTNPATTTPVPAKATTPASMRGNATTSTMTTTTMTTTTTSSETEMSFATSALHADKWLLLALLAGSGLLRA